MIESGACLLAYFFVFWANNIASSDLVGFAASTDPKTLGNGTVLTGDQQQTLVNQAMSVEHTLHCTDKTPQTRPC